MKRLLTSKNALLITSSLVEVGAGVTLCSDPAKSVFLLTGSTLDGAAAATITRIAGAAVIALGIACFLARKDSQSPAARGVIFAMSFYNAAAVAIFLWGRIQPGLNGMLLWPAVLLHSTMLIWCICAIRHRS